eukprot:g5450.t1
MNDKYDDGVTLVGLLGSVGGAIRNTRSGGSAAFQRQKQRVTKYFDSTRPALRFGDDVRHRPPPKKTTREKYLAWRARKKKGWSRYLRNRFKMFGMKLCVRTIRKHKAAVSCCKCSPDGTTLVTASHDCTIKLWAIKRKYKCIATLAGHTREVLDVSISHCSSFVASASWDRTVRLWRIPSGMCIHIFRGHKHKVLTVDFSDDSTLLASGDMGSKIFLWNVNVAPTSSFGTIRSSSSRRRRPQIAHIYKRGQSGYIFCVKFSPNGSHFLASGAADSTIRLYTGKLCSFTGRRREHLLTFQSHIGPVTCLAFSPDTKLTVVKERGVTTIEYEGRLVSGSGDTHLKLWRLGLTKPARAAEAPIGKVKKSKGIIGFAVQKLEEVKALEDADFIDAVDEAESRYMKIRTNFNDNEGTMSRPVSRAGTIANIDILDLRPFSSQSRSRLQTPMEMRPPPGHAPLSKNRPWTAQTMPEIRDFSSINQFRPVSRLSSIGQRRNILKGVQDVRNIGRPVTAPVHINMKQKLYENEDSDNRSSDDESSDLSITTPPRNHHVPGRAGELIDTLDNLHDDFILNLIWSSDGSLLVTSSHDRSITFIEVDSNNKLEVLCEVPAHDEAISGLCFINENRIATASWDKSIKVWATCPIGFDSFDDFFQGMEKNEIVGGNKNKRLRKARRRKKRNIDNNEEEENLVVNENEIFDHHADQLTTSEVPLFGVQSKTGGSLSYK